MRFMVNNQKGQTAIEYMLLLLVVVSVITSLLMVIKNKYLGDPQNCDKGSNRQGLLCKIAGFIEPRPGVKPFQYFPFKK